MDVVIICDLVLFYVGIYQSKSLLLFVWNTLTVSGTRDSSTIFSTSAIDQE